MTRIAGVRVCNCSCNAQRTQRTQRTSPLIYFPQLLRLTWQLLADRHKETPWRAVNISNPPSHGGRWPQGEGGQGRGKEAVPVWRCHSLLSRPGLRRLSMRMPWKVASPSGPSRWICPGRAWWGWHRHTRSTTSGETPDTGLWVLLLVVVGGIPVKLPSQ